MVKVDLPYYKINEVAAIGLILDPGDYTAAVGNFSYSLIKINDNN
jgi:hypothetical protein